MIIIDRLEEQWAVLEYSGVTFNVPRKLLPPGAREGDVLNVTFSIDQQSTETIKDDVKKLVQDLFQD